MSDEKSFGLFIGALVHYTIYQYLYEHVFLIGKLIFMFNNVIYENLR